MNQNSFWNTGSGDRISFNEMLTVVRNHPGSQIHIGTDSQVKKEKVNFAIAICVVQPKKGGRYFYRRIWEKKYLNAALGSRLQKEVTHSIDVAQEIQKHIDASRISIHIDINQNPKFASSKFLIPLVNYVKSMGYSCFVKPDSWASFSIADRHTK